MKALVAEFHDSGAILEGAGQARARGFPLLDALTPLPLESLGEMLGASASPRLRGLMALAGFGAAALFFALETWSAVFAYPFNEGGRPLFSWPVFLLSPFEVGVLAAAVAGFGAFLLRCGLPRLNHPLFTVPGLERASQDRFFLVVDPVEEARIPTLRDLLFGAGATAVTEAET
jgi:hypothetical protein